MDDVRRALEKAAESVARDLSNWPDAQPTIVDREIARAAVLAFLKEMPIKVISESAHMTITRDWSVPEMIAAIEKEQP